MQYILNKPDHKPNWKQNGKNLAFAHNSAQAEI